MTYISAFMPRDEKGFITEDVVYVYECINHKNILKKYPAIFEYYTKSERGQYTSIFGETLTKVVYSSTREFRIAKKEALENGDKLYESDIPPETKVLMEHYYGKPAPDLNVLFYDIEVDYVSRKFNDADIVTIRAKGDDATHNEELKLIRELEPHNRELFELYDDMLKQWVSYEDSRFSYMGETGFSSPLNPYAPINAISIFKQWLGKSIVLAVPPKGWDISELDQSLSELAEIRFFKTEKELLMEFLSELEDANVLSGYNSSYFDDPYVAKRVEMVLGDYFFKKLSMKKANLAQFREVFVKGKKQLQVQLGGRAQLDYLELFKKFEQAERPSYKLEAISAEILPHLTKLEYTGTLEQLYNNDFNHFLRYNIRDTEILNGFEQKLNYIKLANDMIHSNTSNFNNIFGTVRVVDNSIINYCHHVKNVIVPDKWDTADGSIQGAYVLYPQKGMHRWICAIDINSLYPSAMRAINISPETMIGQFIDNMKAWKCISERVEMDLAFKYENGSIEVKTTSEWIELFLAKKWAVSGYGTVYDQNEEGVIPSLLSSWYTLRKEYQALKKKFGNMCDELKLEHGTLTAKQLKEYDALDDNHKKEYKLKNAKLSKEHKKQYDEYYEESKKNDRFQYIYKILLNSTYGCLSNYNFRFFRLEAGESVTGTGRMILKHQCREVNKMLEGKYDIEFPLYESKKVIDKMIKVYNKKMAVIHAENKPEVAEDASLHQYIETLNQEYYHPSLLTHDIALDGPVFKGKFTSKSVIYGDSVAGDTIIYLSDKCVLIEDLMTDDIIYRDDKEYCNLNNVQALTYDKLSDTTTFRDIKYVMRHKCEKQMYRVWTSNNSYIDVTEDHSLMHFVNGVVSEVKPFEDIGKLICVKGTDTVIDTLIFDSKDTAMIQVFDMLNNGQYATVTSIGDMFMVNSANIKSESIGKGFNISDVYKIEKISYDGYVYDIEVDDTHVFYANNILVHNTDSTYFTVPAKDKEEAVEMSDFIAERVNKSYPKFMKNAFLCQPVFDKMIACGREIVGDNSIFVNKKLYTIHVVDNEGKAEDKIKTMGLAIKKTTLPKPIATKLTSFVKRLLIGEDWSTISRDVVDYKKELKNLDNLLEMGLPKGVNGLEDYYKKYLDNAGTNLPGHVAASIFYNMNLKEYEDYDNAPISSGNKIKVYYLKKPMGRFKAIALPTDLEMVPEWFTEHFINRLDVDLQISKLVDDPFQSILEAIDYKVPTEQLLSMEDAFEWD